MQSWPVCHLFDTSHTIQESIVVQKILGAGMHQPLHTPLFGSENEGLLDPDTVHAMQY